MEKKAVDRRIQRTRQLLQSALLSLILEKGYEAVTVQDIIDRANVGRATFYAHFQDKEDLLLSEFEALRAQLERHLIGQAGSNPWELILVMFQHAASQLQLYQALAGKQGGNVMIPHMSKYLFALLRDHFGSHFAGRKDLQVPLDVLAHYLVSTFMALLTWWLNHDLPYSAERMYDMYCQLAQPGVASVLSQLP